MFMFVDIVSVDSWYLYELNCIFFFCISLICLIYVIIYGSYIMLIYKMYVKWDVFLKCILKENIFFYYIYMIENCSNINKIN